MPLTPNKGASGKPNKLNGMPDHFNWVSNETFKQAFWDL